MPESGKHIINRINASVNCGRQHLNSVQEVGWASYISESLEGIVPLLDDKFGKKTVRLEELTITLNIESNRLPDLSDLLKESLQEALSNLEKKDLSASKTGYRERVKLESDQVFLYFLTNGRMPWFTANLEYEEAYFSDQGYKAKCLAILKASSSARERLIQQFTRAEVFSVLSSLYPPEFVSALFDLSQFITESTHRYSERYAAGFRLGQFLLVAGLGYLQKAAPSYSLYDFLNWRSHEIMAEIKKECNGRHPSFIKSIQEELEKRYQLQIDFEERTSDLVTTKEMGSPIAKSTPEEDEQLMGDLWADAKKEDQELVLNAGIVLLHPFLKRFFKKVGLLENDRFISIAHQQRGICLLHNLATGELIFPEEKLLFYKFLCHYPLDHPIPRELPISDFELEEVQQVLHSAIAHWAALKRTSIAGLRMNFLQRKGLLEKDAMGYALHVESLTADILLDQLPWGLSAAHWPWLPHLLTIKWR